MLLFFVYYSFIICSLFIHARAHNADALNRRRSESLAQCRAWALRAALPSAALTARISENNKFTAVNRHQYRPQTQWNADAGPRRTVFTIYPHLHLQPTHTHVQLVHTHWVGHRVAGGHVTAEVAYPRIRTRTCWILLIVALFDADIVIYICMLYILYFIYIRVCDDRTTRWEWNDEQ